MRIRELSSILRHPWRTGIPSHPLIAALMKTEVELLSPEEGWKLAALGTELEDNDSGGGGLPAAVATTLGAMKGVC